MRELLYFIGVLSLIGGILVATQAQSAIHEILVTLSFILAAICFSGGGIIGALRDVKKATEEAASFKLEK